LSYGITALNYLNASLLQLLEYFNIWNGGGRPLFKTKTTLGLALRLVIVSSSGHDLLLGRS
jgi:hypothetical protein